MSSKSPVRSCEDVDETTLSYAEIKALCAGNPLIAEKMNLDIEIAKLRLLKSDYLNQHYRLEDRLMLYYPEQIAKCKQRIVGIEKDIETYKQRCTPKNEFPEMIVLGKTCYEKADAANALLDACKSVTAKEELSVGSYMGFKLNLCLDPFKHQIALLIKGALTYEVLLGTDAFGNITRLNNALEKLPEYKDDACEQLKNLYAQQDAAKEELNNPFTLDAQIKEKEARLAALDAQLNMDDVETVPKEQENQDVQQQSAANKRKLYDKGKGDEKERERRHREEAR
jgi:hypothetical protein